MISETKFALVFMIDNKNPRRINPKGIGLIYIYIYGLYGAHIWIIWGLYGGIEGL